MDFNPMGAPPPMAAPAVAAKGGNTTLYIVLFFLCVISIMAGSFYFMNQSQAAKAARDVEKIQAEAASKMKDAKSDFEKQQIQAEAVEKTRAAELKVEFTGKEAALEARAKGKEEQLKALEAKVNSELAAAAKTVKAANELKAKAIFEKNPAAKRLREAEAAKAKADASGKAIDKKLADEKAKLAKDANVKVAAANKKAADAAKKAKAEAAKALSLRKQLELAGAQHRQQIAQKNLDIAKAKGDVTATARAAVAAKAKADAAFAAAKAAAIAKAAAAMIAKKAVGITQSGSWKVVGLNRDYPGRDVFHLHPRSNPKASRGSCLARCASQSNCNYVTMNKAGTLCWGKSSLGESRPDTDRINFMKPKTVAKVGSVMSRVVSKVGSVGIPVITQSGSWKVVGLNRDYRGSDVFHLHPRSNPKASTGSCLARCASQSNCNYVTMNKAGTLCWGKSKLGKSRPNTDRINYMKPKTVAKVGSVMSNRLRKIRI